MSSRSVAIFDSTGSEYSRAFHTFLAHTDQKEKAIEWLDREVRALPRRQVAIDAGAGTGKLTAWLVGRFDAVTGIEPNPSLAAEFRTTCPSATLLPAPILSASPPSAADFILCSHVFYYVPRAEWEASARQLMSWLAPGGVLAVAIQNPDTDCMRMLDHFIGGRFDLGELAGVARSDKSGQFDVRLDTVEAKIRTDDLRTACEIAEFMLNLLPMPRPPAWVDLERYVADRFVQPGGGYEISCHQDFLRIARQFSERDS